MEHPTEANERQHQPRNDQRFFGGVGHAAQFANLLHLDGSVSRLRYVAFHCAKHRAYRARGWVAALTCLMAVLAQVAGAPMHHWYGVSESHVDHRTESCQADSPELPAKFAAVPGHDSGRDDHDQHDESHCPICLAIAQARLALVTPPDTLSGLIFDRSFFSLTTHKSFHLPLTPILLGLRARGPPCTV